MVSLSWIVKLIGNIMNILHRGIVVLLLSFLIPISSFAESSCSKLSDIKVLSWAYESMLATYNIDFTNYKKQLPEAAKYYTEDAWLSYQKQLHENTALLQKDKLVMTAGLEHSPVLLKKTNNLFVVQMPLLLNYQSADSLKVKKKMVTLEIAIDSQSEDCLKIKKITDK